MEGRASYCFIHYLFIFPYPIPNLFIFSLCSARQGGFLEDFEGGNRKEKPGRRKMGTASD
jgi:hypothetical protein